jgi:amino acid transporter
MKASAQSRVELAKELGAMQLFSLAFGAIIGVGWVVVLGQLLSQAGPLGAILGFAAGALFMMIVGMCYAEMSTLLPVSGAEVAYAYAIFGVRASFAMGWFLSLAQIAVTSFEAISAGWILSTLFPIIKGHTLYISRGYPVELGGLIIALGGMALLTWLNYRGAKSAALFEQITTYGLLLLFLVFVLAGLIGGRASNMVPLWSKDTFGANLGGFLGILMAAPWWYAGFNIIPQVMEEKSSATSLKRAGSVILLSIGGAGVFYCLVILAASMATPWRTIIDMEFPAVGAFEAAFKSPLMAKLVLFAAVFGLVACWNVIFMSASRILFALGRAQIIHPLLGKVHRVHGSPFVAVLFVGLVGSGCVFLGKSAILPIINLTSTCYAFGFLITCLGVLKLRITRPHQTRPYRVPGGRFTATLGVLASLVMIVLSVYEPYKSSKGAVPIEWIVFAVWIALGALFWMLAGKIRRGVSEEERRALILGESAVPID